MTETFRIVLKDVKRHDPFESREFDLPINSTFPIGRASKNATKRELMPAPHNAYIDSPVISREHAILSANTTSGTPQVYISDSGSMHGTMVNGRRLLPNTPERLSPGDLLQFGIDVNRNEEHFVARKYTFESRLSRPFSLGFAVPDAESEDEDLDVDERRGSQLHPLTIDDSDSGSEHSINNDPEITIIEEIVLQEEEVAPVAITEVQAVLEEYPEPAVRSTVLEDNYSDEETGDLIDSSESEEDDVPDVYDDIESEAASVGSSEQDYNSEREIPDSEDEEPAAFPPYRPTINHQVNPSATFPVVSPQQSSICLSTLQPRDLFNLEDITTHQPPGLPPLGMFNQHFDGQPFADSIAPPLPPRPTAPRPAPWNQGGFPIFGQQNDNQAWYSDDMPAHPSYIGTNFGDRPSIFSPPPPPPPPETRGPCVHFGAAPATLQPANRLQTPPPMPASDITMSTPPQPNRRTKVSIEEIVEEQPLTPTSINGMKRKAEVMEGEQTPTVVAPPADLNEARDVAAVEAETAAIVAQRPKKQPRSIMAKVFNTAAYPLLGAAVSFTLLSTLPDAFFGA
ncbi:hypothetical protein BKA66DRAFT_549290 [Pyrenochaeta sp. MPI-SDFR-AT-0127]|nr:hypothetical protein BKA66DRAFT_549290 [Pyrenochaeta sp. MPI-SDFR-AT-0127]